MELVIQAFFWKISMVLYIRMVVKQLGSRVAQLVGGAKVGHGAMVAKSDPRRLLSSQELLVRCHPFLSCSPSPATRVPMIFLQNLLMVCVKTKAKARINIFG